MMKGKNFRKCALCICIASMLSTFFAFPVTANSAQYHWNGTTATGAIVTDDICPVIVEKEVLTFDIQEFPRNYDKELKDYLAYSGHVTAKYTFYNPSDDTVCATVVFPFGTVPHYGYLHDTETSINVDTEKYDVIVNDTVIEKTLRHTLTSFGAQFELSKDMALLHDTYMADDFYHPDMPVTRYTYVPENVDTETYHAANAAFILSADPSKTRVLMENQNGGKLLDNGVQLECWVEDASFTVNVIGEPLRHMPEWKFYENGACEKEIPGNMVLTNTEVTTLKDFALSKYDANAGILEHDWYNAIIASMKSLEWSNGAISGSEFQSDLSDYLMRWYEYEITLQPGERITNTITAPIYPSFDTSYEPPIYEYTYLLSPAQSWKSFGTLDIMINTPYYMTESGWDGFERTNEGYACHLTGLPEDELTFTLCLEPEPPVSDNRFPLAAIIVFVVGFIVIVVLLRSRKRHA